MKNNNRKDRLFIFLTICFSLLISVIIGELMVRFILPQRSLYPRWGISKKYYHESLPNSKMVHVLPGQWEFVYTVNKNGHRGPAIPILDKYDKKNIVVLGDSYSFGMGVNDGEEFSAVMRSILNDNYNVINLATAGYGLTQEIRRYYDFGQLYQPDQVILQFCSNDPEENFSTNVTEVKDGHFVFYDAQHSFLISTLKNFLSRSPLQKSQLFNLIFNLTIRSRPTSGVPITCDTKRKDLLLKANNSKEEFYNLLLETFAKDLNSRGIQLLMISVHGQLDKYPNIRRKISELAAKNYLDYIETKPWFENLDNYQSPEGHRWGKKAHFVVGSKLAKYLTAVYP